jgi:hypothetical protein
MRGTRPKAYHRLVTDVHAGKAGSEAAMEINRRQDLWAEFYRPGNAWHPGVPGLFETSMESG